MPLLDDLLAGLPDGEVAQVTIGLHWTAVAARVGRELRCGLASTLGGAHSHHNGPDVPQAGRLEQCSGRELAALAGAEQPALRSVGFAAINALLPRHPELWTDLNAEEAIAAHGAGKTVALIGHFPFTERLRERVGALHVLEQHPHPGDLLAGAAPEVLPGADVVAITGMTLLNGTFEGLRALCRPEATVLLLGPSAPLSPVLFHHGVTLVAGTVVEDVDVVLRYVRQGASFRQVHGSGGVRLVTMARPAR